MDISLTDMAIIVIDTTHTARCSKQQNKCTKQCSVIPKKFHGIALFCPVPFHEIYQAQKYTKFISCMRTSWRTTTTKNHQPTLLINLNTVTYKLPSKQSLVTNSNNVLAIPNLSQNFQNVTPSHDITTKFCIWICTLCNVESDDIYVYAIS